MDPQDRLRSLLDGIACSACEVAVTGERIRLLARREDLAFVEIACADCGSTTLGFVVDESGSPNAVDRAAGATPVSTDDVLDMHIALEDWQGDLRSLLGSRPAPDAGRPR